MPRKRKTEQPTLLYGLWGDCLVVLDRDWAHAAAAELDRLAAATTWR